MAKSKIDKKKQKRKKKQKQIRQSRSKQIAKNKAWIDYEDALYFYEFGNIDLAENRIKKSARLLSYEEDVIRLMGIIASRKGDHRSEVESFNRLEKIGKITEEMQIERITKLFFLEKYQLCLQKVNEVIKRFPKFKIKDKRKKLSLIKEIKGYCKHNIAVDKVNKNKSRQDPSFVSNVLKNDHHTGKTIENITQKPLKTSKKSRVSQSTGIALSTKVAKVPMTVRIDKDSFLKVLADPAPISPDRYELSLMSHEIRFAESFETLICLPALTQIRSFWYQEETAKKVLKRFRGRALLSDEVGLGKTIEALIILSEYIRRGLVKTGLILTPTPLVSQWQEEMKTKFNLEIPSTDDSGFKSGDKAFWQQPLVVASINQAKSKKNAGMITQREYDIVIVDEAHHLKNRTTLNFKLVNSLKKRFILLLTATPVENNLMELYNLITLLKPGQLETATAFRERFMKRGDPTDPQNKGKLKELLGQVMIRNTRALAGINIPPRFARTIRINPVKAEMIFYDRLQALIMSLNMHRQGRARMIIKNLLAQAGSSPTAVEGTLDKMLEKNDYLKFHEQQIRALKNLCRTTLDTPKNKALLKLIMASREKIIVFVKYRGTLDHLAEFLEWNNISFSFFHGGMSNRKKDEAIQAFKDTSRVLVTTEIGGEGRNIQFCSQMVNYDLPWNPMKIEQRIGRIHRIGQKKEVQIYNFCAAGSIEDYILDILDRKINMFEMVIGEIDMILGRVKGEKEFSDIVYDIWVNSDPGPERQKSFSNLGTRLKRAKTGYEKTRELDGKLFGDTYEL